MNFPVKTAKATDVIARLIELSGPKADFLRIAKLVYLADRQSIITRGVPILGGHYSSRRKGPVILEMLEFVKKQNAPRWKEVIAPRTGDELALAGKTDYLSLSESELEIIDAVFAEHANLSTEQLVDWCHQNCPEYEHVTGGESRPIGIEAILEAAHVKSAQIEKLVARAQELNEFDALLA